MEKLEDYRENVAKIDDARKLEMGFLIEVHSDFRGLYLNNNGKSCQLKQGECPLPSDLYEMLKETSVNIDWLLLGFYPSLSDTPVDAAVVNCRHGMFAESCKRQGVVKAEYLQLDSNEKSKRFEFTGYEQARLLGRIRGSEAMPRQSRCGWCAGRSRLMRCDAVVRCNRFCSV